jgi:hypothetical protein
MHYPPFSPVYTEKYTIDKTAPKVLTIYPKNAYTKLLRTATIVISFTETIKSSD